MKCREIVELLETLAPRRCACDWDNPGLLAGRQEKEVRKLLLTLDADDAAVARAKEIGADMIVSHHPLLFRPVKHVTDEDFIGRRLIAMLQADLSYFAMHTNYDAARGCMADAAARRLGIVNGEPLEEMGEEGGVPFGIGKIGPLREPTTGIALAKKVKESFGLPFAVVYGSGLYEDEEHRIRIAATCPGSGGSTVGEAIQKGAQVLITGDIGHHDGIDAAAQGLMIIDAGHYGLEHIFMDEVEEYLRERLPETVTVEKMPVKFPAVLI